MFSIESDAQLATHVAVQAALWNKIQQILQERPHREVGQLMTALQATSHLLRETESTELQKGDV